MCTGGVRERRASHSISRPTFLVAQRDRDAFREYHVRIHTDLFHLA